MPSTAGSSSPVQSVPIRKNAPMTRSLASCSSMPVAPSTWIYHRLLHSSELPLCSHSSCPIPRALIMVYPVHWHYICSPWGAQKQNSTALTVYIRIPCPQLRQSQNLVVTRIGAPSTSNPWCSNLVSIYLTVGTVFQLWVICAIICPLRLTVVT